MTLGLWSYDIEALIATGRLEGAQLVPEDLLRRASYSEMPSPVKRQLDRELLQRLGEPVVLRAQKLELDLLDRCRPSRLRRRWGSSIANSDANHNCRVVVPACDGGGARAGHIVRAVSARR